MYFCRGDKPLTGNSVVRANGRRNEFLANSGVILYIALLQLY